MSTRERVNILLVDDQPSKLLSLETILSDLGENLIQTGSANEALRVLLEVDVAVVLVDVCMPRMDGFELAELIRGHPRFERTAIIFISAVHLSDDDRLKGYRLGAVDYIPVPIIPEVLRAKVAVFAELYRKTQELARVNAELELRVAELNQTNERLRLADRMATIGTLSAGLGHDMGNLLVPIRVRLETLENANLSEDYRADVQAIKTSTQYLQRLANGLRLLAVSPERSGQGEPAEIGTWWDDALPLLKSVLPMGMRLAAERPTDEVWLTISRAGLTQAVFNLVQNAGDAMRERGSGTVTVACHSEGPCLVLSVADDGPGMSAEVKQRCMEPFFTTKTRSISTGLGLTLVYGLVQDSGGAIALHTEAGKGTCFSLRLPRRASPIRVMPDSQAKAAFVSLNDARLRAFAAAELRALGFKVLRDAAAEADIAVVESVPADIKVGAQVVLVGVGKPEGAEKHLVEPTPSAIRDAIRRVTGVGAAGPVIEAGVSAGV